MRIQKGIFLIILFIAFSGCNSKKDEGLAIYLLNNSDPQQLSILSHLDLADKPLLIENDIISYQDYSHVIELTAEGIEKIQNLEIPMSGLAFAVCVNHEPIYAGAFWIAYSSHGFDGIIIDVTFVSEENPKIQIQLGNPDSSFFQGEDLRSDPRILEALLKADKLK